MNHANAFLPCPFRGLFPVPANLGEKAFAHRALFAEHLVGAVAVEADCGGTDQHFRRPLEPGEGFT